MFHPGDIDWWLFIYSPAIFLVAGLILGWPRWTRRERISNLIPFVTLLTVSILIRWTDIFLGDSFSYFSALYFSCCWVLIANLGSPGIILFSSGGILNAFAAIMNGGKMPVFGEKEISLFHQPMNFQTKFIWMCDWIMTPNDLYVMSPGDLLLIIGAVIFFMQEFRITNEGRNNIPN